MECLPRAMKDMSSSDKEANDKEDGMSRERPRKATSATSQQMIRHIDMLQRAKKLMDGQDAMDVVLVDGGGIDPRVCKLQDEMKACWPPWSEKDAAQALADMRDNKEGECDSDAEAESPIIAQPNAEG